MSNPSSSSYVSSSSSSSSSFSFSSSSSPKASRAIVVAEGASSGTPSSSLAVLDFFRPCSCASSSQRRFGSGEQGGLTRITKLDCFFLSFHRRVLEMEWNQSVDCLSAHTVGKGYALAVTLI